MSIFAIVTASDFYAKTQEDVRQFNEQIDDFARAMNAILSTYHLHEWVWARWLKAAAPRTICGVLIRDKAGFLAWLDTACPHFAILQELANGSKHCSPVVANAEISGYGMGPYGVGPYGKPYLLIDKGDALPLDRRWLVASDMLNDVASFWNQFFSDNGPIP